MMFEFMFEFIFELCQKQEACHFIGISNINVGEMFQNDTFCSAIFAHVTCGVVNK